jgi:hypothetical protein
MCLPAKIYTLGMPLLRPEQQRFRVAATGFEIVWVNDGDSSFTASLDFGARVDLASIGRFARTLVWMEQGPIDVQVWVKGHRLVGGVLEADPVRQSYDWQKVLDVVETLELLPSDAELPRPCASVADIGAAAKDLYLMHEVLSDSTFRMEFLPLPGAPTDFIAALYYSTARVGDLTAYALVERRLIAAADVEDGRRRLDFDRPIIRESWLVADATETRRRMMLDDYRHHLSSMAASGTVMELFDIAEFVRAMKGE